VEDAKASGIALQSLGGARLSVLKKVPFAHYTSLPFRGEVV
jgi:hypothetical protein